LKLPIFLFSWFITSIYFDENEMKENNGMISIILFFTTQLEVIKIFF
jgi:hypothetical protein